MINVDKVRADETLLKALIHLVDDLAGNLPDTLGVKSPWVMTITKMFNTLHDYRAVKYNKSVEDQRVHNAKVKPLIKLKLQPTYAEPTDQDNFIPLDERPHVNVGTVGHIDHGKATLTAAVLAAADVTHKKEPLVFGDKNVEIDLNRVRANELNDGPEFKDGPEFEGWKERSGESDPNGLDASAPGAKLDAGKAMVDDILGGFARALMGVAELGTFGANKYSLHGWASVEDGVRRYRNAAGRHRLARQSGIYLDDGPKGTGLPHAYCEAWNTLAALELELRAAEKS